jgi:hypothetical protein
METGMVTYRVYRHPYGDLKERLREALRDYYGRHGRLPGSVVVHPSLVRRRRRRWRRWTCPGSP